jgi:pyridinium-3,5-bisthiocarboxylic acid mononucleotide nickel chelatase
MRIAYLDCFSGISGDMFLGALLDAGIPFELFEKTVVDLNVGATIERSQVDRAGLAATKLDVIVGGEKDMPREEYWKSRDQGSRARDQSLGNGGHSHPQRRRLSDILSTIAAARISERAQQLANEMFLALATAEAKIHNASLEDVHFHEVGAADAIVDIVCAAAGAEALAVDEFVFSPLNVGGGTVVCAHGTLPAPAPATLELLKGAPIYSGEIQKELVTPTGAAIVKVLVSSFGPRPAMTTETIGYGAGARDFSGHPNVLRISIGELAATEISAGAASQETIAILEANLDDLNPQLIGYIVDQAFAEGALDVFTTPVQMKKNRPGTVLTILAPPDKENSFRALLFRESSTLGVRVRHQSRYVLPRHHESVSTPWGTVRMKVAGVNGSASQYAPEYEDCRRIATEHHVPLKHVMQEALRLYMENHLDRQHG